MKSYMAFMSKEVLEHIRNRKFFIMLVIFIMVGILGPLLAKLTPYMVEKMQTGNMEIKVPTPVESDAWMYFFQNMSQIGMFALVLIIGNHISGEFNRGTLVNLLSKGLSRKTVVASKWTFDVILWTVSYVVSVIIAYIYIGYLFGNKISVSVVLSALLLSFVYGILLISVELLGGILTGKTSGAISTVAVFIIVQMLLSLKEAWGKYMPVGLASEPVQIIMGTGKFSDYVPALTVSVVMIILTLVLSFPAINKRRIG